MRAGIELLAATGTTVAVERTTVAAGTEIDSLAMVSGGNVAMETLEERIAIAGSDEEDWLVAMSVVEIREVVVGRTAATSVLICCCAAVEVEATRGKVEDVLSRAEVPTSALEVELELDEPRGKFDPVFVAPATTETPLIVTTSPSILVILTDTVVVPVPLEI
jgi:hypothetical protein